MTALIITETAGTLVLLAGAFFAVIGAVGLFRLPDFYTRLHAAGITDTLGSLLILGGLAISEGATLITVKLLFIALFILFTSPTATHAIANAAWTAGIKPAGLINQPPGPPKEEDSSSPN